MVRNCFQICKNLEQISNSLHVGVVKLAFHNILLNSWYKIVKSDKKYIRIKQDPKRNNSLRHVTGFTNRSSSKTVDRRCTPHEKLKVNGGEIWLEALQVKVFTKIIANDHTKPIIFSWKQKYSQSQMIFYTSLYQEIT